MKLEPISGDPSYRRNKGRRSKYSPRPTQFVVIEKSEEGKELLRSHPKAKKPMTFDSRHEAHSYCHRVFKSAHLDPRYKGYKVVPIGSLAAQGVR